MHLSADARDHRRQTARGERRRARPCGEPATLAIVAVVGEIHLSSVRGVERVPNRRWMKHGETNHVSWRDDQNKQHARTRASTVSMVINE
jgi:hypothetical protein